MQDGSEDCNGFKRKSVIGLLQKIAKSKKAAADELFEN
jgi:hypothetical protein